MAFILELSLVYFPTILAIFVVVRKLYLSLTSPLSDITGPKGGHWLWGHELMTFENSYGDIHIEWIESFGTTYKIKGALLHPDILITADAGALSQIFGKETYSYVKSPVIRPLVERLLGRSLIWAEGHTHKRQRQQLAPFFTTKATKDMLEVVRTCVNNGAEHLAAYVNETADAKQEAKLDLMDWTGRVTLDIIGRVAFDHDFGCGQSDSAKAIHLSWKNQVNAGIQKTGFIGLLVLRSFSLIARLPLKAIKAQEEVKVIVERIGRSILERNPHESKDGSLLSGLARLAATGDSGISGQELLDHIATITVAGNETTAGSVGFAFYELARNPSVQTQLREEIVQLGHEPTYEDYMDKMPWLDAIVKETFRLYPPIAHMERTAMKDDTLRLQIPLKNTKGQEITQLFVKAGQLIHIPAHSVGRVKSVWGEDAADFKPERWFDASRIPPANDTPPGWNGLMAFSAGPRICIGYRLAVLEFKVMLATYARRFEFRDTGATIGTKFAATLQPYVVGEEAKGRQLPVRVSVIENDC